MNKIKLNIYIIRIGVLLVFGSIYGQQQPNYALYRYTMNAINPSYAGSNGLTNLTVNIRSQWTNIEDAPKTETFFFSTPINERIGIGLSVINDQVFVERNTRFTADLSYKLQFNYNTQLFFGLKVGGSTYNINRNGLANLDLVFDSALGNIDSGFKPNIGVGAHIINDNYFVSLSSPNLLIGDRIDVDNGRVRAESDNIHVYLTGGYNFEVSDMVEFRPSVMMRYVNGSPFSSDITAAFKYDKKIELGAMYRTDGGWAGTLMFDFIEWMDIGYAYEGSTRAQINDTSNGTHEFFIRFSY